MALLGASREHISEVSMGLCLGQQLPVCLGQQLPVCLGQQLPVCLGQQLPVCLGQQLPVCLGQQLPVCLGQQLPVCLGQQLPEERCVMLTLFLMMIAEKDGSTRPRAANQRATIAGASCRSWLLLLITPGDRQHFKVFWPLWTVTLQNLRSRSYGKRPWLGYLLLWAFQGAVTSILGRSTTLP